MNPVSEIEKPFRASVLVSGAAVATLFAYTIMVEIIKWVLRPYNGLVHSSRWPAGRYFLYGAAIIIVIGIRVLVRPLTKKKNGEPLSVFIQKLSRRAIVISVLAESPALLGFIFFLLSGWSRDFYYLLFVSLFLEFMYFPRKTAWEEMVRSNHQQTPLAGS